MLDMKNKIEEQIKKIEPVKKRINSKKKGEWIRGSNREGAW